LFAHQDLWVQYFQLAQRHQQGQDHQKTQDQKSVANTLYLLQEFALNERYEKRKKRCCIQQRLLPHKKYLKTKFPDTEIRRHKK
tara:strand:+ start:554 stop:805 length:252 start_codon:yes stop_codon:yes gene_type:complete